MSLSFARRVGRVLRGIRPDFSRLSPASGQVTYVLLSRLPLSFPGEPGRTVRLACIRRTASVRPEPGSNSMKLLVSFHYPVVKVPATRTACSREYHPLGRPPAAKSMISDITRKGQALSAPFAAIKRAAGSPPPPSIPVIPSARSAAEESTASARHPVPGLANMVQMRSPRRNQPLATTPLTLSHSCSRIRRNQPGCRLATTPLTYSTLLRSWCIWSPAVPPSMAR